MEQHGLGISAIVCLECGGIKWSSTYIILVSFRVNEESQTLFSHRAFGSNPVSNLTRFGDCVVILYLFRCC